MRGKQTALSAGTHYDIISREMPLFSVIAMPAEGVKTDTLIAQLRQEIKDIADNGVSEEELQRVKTRAAVNEIYAKDSMSSQASMMGRLEARGFNIPTNKKSTAACRPSARKKYRPPPGC